MRRLGTRTSTAGEERGDVTNSVLSEATRTAWKAVGFPLAVERTIRCRIHSEQARGFLAACWPARAFSSVGRAAGLQPAGRRFEPGSAHCEVFTFLPGIITFGCTRDASMTRCFLAVVGAPDPMAAREIRGQGHAESGVAGVVYELARRHGAAVRHGRQLGPLGPATAGRVLLAPIS